MKKASKKRNKYKELKEAGNRPVTVWLTGKRHKKLADRAEALGVQPAGLVRILIHSLLEDTAEGK